MSDSSNFWHEMEEEANRDDRIGDHIFRVSSVEEGQWPSGDVRFKVRGTLETAGMARCDITLSEVPTTPEQQARAKEATRGAKGMMVENKKMVDALDEYGFAPEGLTEGDRIAVKVTKNKKTGYLDIREIYGKEKLAVLENGGSGDDHVPF